MSDRGRTDVIERWMLQISADGGIDRYDELHIDRINKAWSDRTQWLEGGLEAFRIALDIRRQFKLRCTVVVAFSLMVGDSPRGITFSTPQELKTEFNWSPPALYLFRKGEEPWARPGAAVVVDPVTSAALFGNSTQAVVTVYTEFVHSLGELSRSIALAG